MSNNLFTFNFFTKEIHGTKRAFAEASKGYGDAYEELMRKMKEHSDFSIVEDAPKSHINRAKRSFEGLNKKLITDYIKIQPNAEVLRKELEAIEKNAKEAKLDVFPKVRRWFLEKYNTEEHPFDVAKAKEAIAINFVEDSNKSVAKNVIQFTAKTAEDNLLDKASNQ